MTDEAKTEADQVGEITKLVEDAQEKLDQVVRALRMLPQPGKPPDPGGPIPTDGSRARGSRAHSRPVRIARPTQSKTIPLRSSLRSPTFLPRRAPSSRPSSDKPTLTVAMIATLRTSGVR